MNRKLILLAFFFAGFTTFIYEIAWARPLQSMFGSTIYAATIILASFLAGFSLGSYMLGKRISSAKSALHNFMLIEAGIGLYGLIMVGILLSLPSAYTALISIPGFEYLKFLIFFAVLIVPATLMGAAWPAVNNFYVRSQSAGSDSGSLYSSNSLGGAAGSIAAGFFLMPVLGIAATSAIAALMNLGIAALVFFQIRRKKHEG